MLVQSYYYLGKIQNKLKKLDKALEFFEQAYKLSIQFFGNND